LDAVLGSAPADYRKWLEQKLEYSNELSLRRRLKELLTPFPALYKELGGASFVNRILDTRNYLTHYDEKSRMNAAQGERLHWLSEKLRIVVEMCLLTELGISASAMSDILLRQPGNQHALAQPS
jgi:ApeA N-terminal domain 1